MLYDKKRKIKEKNNYRVSNNRLNNTVLVYFDSDHRKKALLNLETREIYYVIIGS